VGGVDGALVGGATVGGGLVGTATVTVGDSSVDVGAIAQAVMKTAAAMSTII
jgi:hypothetical protein